MSYIKHAYHDDICENYYGADEELGQMLEEMYYLECINDADEYMDYLSTLRNAGFSKEDALSIFTPLISEDQEMN